jgi:hypothetical protein
MRQPPKVIQYFREWGDLRGQIVKFDSSKATLLSATDKCPPSYVGGNNLEASPPLMNYTRWLFHTPNGRFVDVETSDVDPSIPVKVFPVHRDAARKIYDSHTELSENCIRQPFPDADADTDMDADECPNPPEGEPEGEAA